jgi:dolichyl-phosphate-mannose-protein mannosyltransferase
LVIRILLFPVQGYKIDLATFSAWFYTAAEYGPRVFYESVGFCDYPPFNVYIFWIFGSLAKWLSLFRTRSIVYAIKLPPTLFDVATAFLLFTFLRKKLDFKSSLVFASFYAFNPATIFNTSVWGQFDAIYTFFLILSIKLILDSKPKLSVVAFTLGVLSKPQSIALAPLIAYLIARERGWKGVVASALVSAATILIVIIPFKWSTPVDFLVDIYLRGYGGYPYTSVNAFNVWAFTGFWRSDGEPFTFLNFFTIGWAMFGAITAFTLYHLNERLDDSQEVPVLFSALVLLFGFFMLPTRIHERYLFPAISVLTLIMPFLKEARPIYGLLTFTCLSNQAYVLHFLNSDRFIPDLDPFVWMVALINLATFLYTLLLMVRGLKTGNRIKPCKRP